MQCTVVMLLLATSVAVGYQLGVRSSYAPLKLPKEKENDNRDPAASDDSDSDGDLGTIQASIMDRCKLVIVVRTDLEMSPGKIAAQCGHATLACYKSMMKNNPKVVRQWERTGQAKIALKADSEEKLMELEAIAKSLNLCARSIHDQGRTEVPSGTRTVLGIGPAPVDLVDQVTGKLRLL